MELFSLLAKLTLDKSEFDSAIKQAESDAKGITIDDPSLGLDDDEFYRKIEDAEETDVDDPDDPSLGLNDDEFYKTVENAENADVDDPDDPSLGLNDDEFYKTVEDAEDADVDDPDEPSLGLDIGEFNDKISEAENAGESFAGNLGNIFSQLKGALIASGIVAAVTGVVSALKEGVELAKNHGDQIDKQSQKMMISKKAYQEYAYALGLSGASIDDLNKGLRNLQKIPGEGLTGDQVKAFEALKISADDAMEQIKEGMANEDLTGFVDKIISGIADADSADQGWIAAALFGNGATGLNAFFNQTSAQIRDAKQEAEDLGMVMSDAEVANAAAYMDATSRMEGAIQGLKEALVKDLLPYLTDAANTIAKIVAFFNPRTGQESLSDKWAGDNEAFAEELVTIEGTAAAAQTLADKLLKMGDTSEMTANQYAIWKGTAEELIKLVPSLGDVIDTETGQINANSSEIAENIKQWENLAKQKALQALKEQKLQDLYLKNQDLIDKSIQANKKASDAETARIEAASKFSKKMQDYGLGSLDLKGDIDKQISDIMTMLAEGGDQYETELAGLGAMLREYGEAKTEAGKAKKEAEDLAKEIEKAKEEYTEWEAAAASMYGITAEQATDATNKAQSLRDMINSIPDNKTTAIHFIYDDFRPFAHHAIGADYIPYDNYPALLHRGEKVLTATEVRRGENSGGNIDYTALEDSIISAIREGMADANVTALVTDRDVARGSNRANGKEMDSRRFRP